MELVEPDKTADELDGLPAPRESILHFYSLRRPISTKKADILVLEEKQIGKYIILSLIQ